MILMLLIGALVEHFQEKKAAREMAAKRAASRSDYGYRVKDYRYGKNWSGKYNDIY